MKMCETELDAFVFKFQQLWNAGIDAHLDLSSQAGVAWVGLRVNLGQFPGPNCNFDSNVVESATHVRKRDKKQHKQHEEVKEQIVSTDVKNEDVSFKLNAENNLENQEVNKIDDVDILKLLIIHMPSPGVFFKSKQPGADRVKGICSCYPNFELKMQFLRVFLRVINIFLINEISNNIFLLDSFT